jgi:hypothetical protein
MRHGRNITARQTRMREGPPAGLAIGTRRKEY